MKILPVGAELFRVDGRTDMTKLTVLVTILRTCLVTREDRLIINVICQTRHETDTHTATQCDNAFQQTPM